MDSKYSENPAIPYRFEVEPSTSELVSVMLFDHGATAVAELEDPSKGTTYLVADLTSSAYRRLCEQGLCGQHVPDDDVDWVDTAAEFQGSYWCGPHVLLHPEGQPLDESQVAPEVWVISIPPTATFGTGSHPTTRLSGELLASTITPGDHVVDIGSGSGVLSVLAALRGAERVDACDIDNMAIRATTALAKSHNVDQVVHVHLGSAQDIAHVFNDDDDDGNGGADVVVANVLLAAMRELSNEITTLIRPHGTLIVSGALKEQRNELLELFTGYELHQERVEGNWIAAVLTRKHN